MKVVVLSTAYPFRGGIAVFSERLAKEFQDHGDEVRISTFKLQYPSLLFPGKSQYSSSDCPKELKIKQEVNSINPFNWIKIGRRIKKEKPDLLILKYWIPFMAPCFGIISRICRKNHHTKVVVVVDNIVPHEKRFGDKILSSFFVNSVDAFIAMSSSVLKDLELFDDKKPKILSPHPLYDNFGKSKTKQKSIRDLGLNPNDKHILFFGIIRKYKGLDLLLEAMANKDIKKLNIKLIVAGEFYEDSTLYFDIVKKHNLSDNIVFTNGFIPDEEVVNYFCAADLIVQPYRSATQSGVTQIAYHFERPMLVTNVGGLDEIVNDKTGYACSPISEEISDSIIDFYTNERESNFVSGIKSEKKKYSWNYMIENIKLLYNKIV